MKYEDVNVWSLKDLRKMVERDINSGVERVAEKAKRISFMIKYLQRDIDITIEQMGNDGYFSADLQRIADKVAGLEAGFLSRIDEEPQMSDNQRAMFSMIDSQIEWQKQNLSEPVKRWDCKKRYECSPFEWSCSECENHCNFVTLEESIAHSQSALRVCNGKLD